MTRQRLSWEHHINADDLKKLNYEDTGKLVTAMFIQAIASFVSAGGDMGKVSFRSQTLNGGIYCQLDGMSVNR